MIHLACRKAGDPFDLHPDSPARRLSITHHLTCLPASLRILDGPTSLKTCDPSNPHLDGPVGVLFVHCLVHLLVLLALLPLLLQAGGHVGARCCQLMARPGHDLRMSGPARGVQQANRLCSGHIVVKTSVHVVLQAAWPFYKHNVSGASWPEVQGTYDGALGEQIGIMLPVTVQCC